MEMFYCFSFIIKTIRNAETAGREIFVVDAQDSSFIMKKATNIQAIQKRAYAK